MIARLTRSERGAACRDVLAPLAAAAGSIVAEYLLRRQRTCGSAGESCKRRRRQPFLRDQFVPCWWKKTLTFDQTRGLCGPDSHHAKDHDTWSTYGWQAQPPADRIQFLAASRLLGQQRAVTRLAMVPDDSDEECAAIEGRIDDDLF